MLRLLGFIKGKELILTIISFLLIMIQTACDIAQPFLVSLILTPSKDSNDFWINEPNNPIGGLWGLAGIMMALILVSLISQAIGISLTTRIGVRLGSNIRHQAFNKIQSLTFNEIEKFTTPSLITRLTYDIMFFQNVVIISLRILFRSFFLIIGGIVATFVLGSQIGMWWIGFIFLAFMFVVMTSIFLLLRKSVPFYKKQQKSLDKVNSVMRENLLGVRVVKAFNMQNDQIDKFDVENENLTKVSIIAGKWSISIVPIIFFVVQISVVVTIMIIASYPQDNVQPTIILQIIQLASLIVLAIILIVTVLISMAYCQASCNRINEIFDAKPSIERNTSTNMIESPKIIFNNVWFKYHTNDETDYALMNINFELNPGEMVGIIGPTGSGKSTLVNLVTRMYDVTNGEILISGKNIKDINYISLRDSIGVSPQKSLIFSGTIASNLKFGKEDATLKEMKEAAAIAQATEFIQGKKGRYDHQIEQRGSNLSGGQKQRLSIARALIKKPKILILDDSTSALDMITEAKVQEGIRQFKNTSIFLVGQRINAISKADKIIVLDKGKMVGYGNHKSLMKNCTLYKDIAISQGFEE